MDLNTVLSSRNQNDVDTTVKEINTNSIVNEKQKVMGFKCDVSIPSDVNSLVKATIEKFEQVDILINNAGISNI